MNFAISGGRRPVALGSAPTRYARLSLLARNRYQLLGALIVGLAIPVHLRPTYETSTIGSNSLVNTIIGTVLALLFGFYLLRRLSAYPGVRALGYVLPAFVATYGAAIIVFFFLRLDYSRYQFIASFLLTVGWFFFATGVAQRVRRPHLVLVPYGQVNHLLERNEVDWDVAYDPAKLPLRASGVVADLRAELPAEWEKYLAACALKGIAVYHSKQIQESLTGTVEIEHLSENNLGSLLPSSVYLRFRRVADTLASLLVLPVALPVMVAIAIAIKLDGRGPVLFRQIRTGYRGELFTMLKFRTMRPAAEGHLSTSKDDPRITRIGRWLRRYRLDELPQLFNVLAGDMSWIGPRPEAQALAAWFETQIPFYSYRHIVRPGITGWAQVNQGYVSDFEGTPGKLHYDFYYIKNFSPWLDLLIVVKTIRTVLTGFGSH